MLHVIQKIWKQKCVYSRTFECLANKYEKLFSGTRTSMLTMLYSFHCRSSRSVRACVRACGQKNVCVFLESPNQSHTINFESGVYIFEYGLITPTRIVRMKIDSHIAALKCCVVLFCSNFKDMKLKKIIYNWKRRHSMRFIFMLIDWWWCPFFFLAVLRLLTP